MNEIIRRELISLGDNEYKMIAIDTNGIEWDFGIHKKVPVNKNEAPLGVIGSYPKIFLELLNTN